MEFLLGTLQPKIVIQIIREDAEENNIPTNRIIIEGSSQCAAMVVLIELSAESYKLASIVSLRAYMPLLWKVMKTMASDSNHRSSIFWGHGDDDQVINHRIAARAVAMLEEEKYDLRFNLYTGQGHKTSPEGMRDRVDIFARDHPCLA